MLVLYFELNFQVIMSLSGRKFGGEHRHGRSESGGRIGVRVRTGNYSRGLHSKHELGLRYLFFVVRHNKQFQYLQQAILKTTKNKFLFKLGISFQVYTN